MVPLTLRWMSTAQQAMRKSGDISARPRPSIVNRLNLYGLSQCRLWYQQCGTSRQYRTCTLLWPQPRIPIASASCCVLTCSPNLCKLHCCGRPERARPLHASPNPPGTDAGHAMVHTRD
eukprot:scaffold549_cov385-Prasinococcus_capsulatus_cf.AAC.44